LQCQWDGGDCCPSTCIVPSEEDVGDDQFISDLSCAPSTFACLDPNANGVPLGLCDARRKLMSREERAFMDTGGETSTHPRNQRRTETDLRRTGDGVCDQDLNNAQSDFDQGDCCPFTCTINPAFPASCLGPFDQCVEDGTDVTAPAIFFDKAPRDSVSDCNLPAPPRAWATDDDPCFDGIVTYKEMRENEEGNNYTLVRTWTAKDPTGNRQRVSTQIAVTCDETIHNGCLDIILSFVRSFIGF
jgi:hypothetical protein